MKEKPNKTYFPIRLIYSKSHKILVDLLSFDPGSMIESKVSDSSGKHDTTV